MKAAEEMKREQKEVKLRMILQDYHRRNNYELQQAVNDILALDALPPAEGAKTCWGCGAEIHYLSNGLPPYRCDCGAVNPAETMERQPQPTAEGAEEFLRRHNISGHDFVYATGFENMVGLLDEFAALYAQQIADKMVGERLRKELMTYDKFLSNTYWGISHITKREEAVDEYLKSREK